MTNDPKENFIPNIDPKLEDFSQSSAAFDIKARLCGCGFVHITMHDEKGQIFAHIDTNSPDAIKGFANDLMEFAAALVELESI